MSGMKGLTDKMEIVRRIMTDNAARKAVRAGGSVIRDAMVERAPVQLEKSLGSDSLEPGELRDGLRVRLTRDGNENVALIGPAGGAGRVSHAAHLVEYGHRMVTGGKSKLDVDGTFRGGGTVHEKDVPAYPFLRPAFEESQSAAMEAVQASLAKDLKEAVK
jgi:HK97 gp10 family phage protein